MRSFVSLLKIKKFLQGKDTCHFRWWMHPIECSIKNHTKPPSRANTFRFQGPAIAAGLFCFRKAWYLSAMTSVEAYQFGMQLANQPASGGFPVARFNDFVNQAQIAKMKELIDNGVDASIMGNESLSPFFMYPTIPLTNGIGFHNPNRDLAFGPTLWMSGYVNPACGETTQGDAPLIPIQILENNAWAPRAYSLIDITSTRNPCARVLGETRIEVRPHSIRFVTGWYVRYPRKIVVGSFIDPDGIERPLEGAPNQVNPEWGDIDMHDIIWLAMSYTGLTLQSDRMQATAERRMVKQ
jgi:hypothetical protein